MSVAAGTGPVAESVGFVAVCSKKRTQIDLDGDILTKALEFERHFGGTCPDSAGLELVGKNRHVKVVTSVVVIMLSAATVKGGPG